MEQRVAVVAAEPVAPVVALAAEFALARDGFDQSLIRFDAEVAAVEVDALSGLERLGMSAAPAVGAVEPAVEAPPQAVDPELRVARLEAAVQHRLHVGMAVVFSVLGIDDVRGGGDDH